MIVFAYRCSTYQNVFELCRVVLACHANFTWHFLCRYATARTNAFITVTYRHNQLSIVLSNTQNASSSSWCVIKAVMEINSGIRGHTATKHGKLNKERPTWCHLLFLISLFNAQHVSDVNTAILRSLRLMCWDISWVVLLWYDACWCYVVVWLGWCGIRMQASACNTDTTPN